MDGVAPSASRKKLVIVDRLYGELSVYVSDPGSTMLILVDEGIGDDEEVECSEEEPRGLDMIPDDAKAKIIEILKASMSPEPQGTTP